MNAIVTHKIENLSQKEIEELKSVQDIMFVQEIDEVSLFFDIVLFEFYLSSIK